MFTPFPLNSLPFFTRYPSTYTRSCMNGVKLFLYFLAGLLLLSCEEDEPVLHTLQVADYQTVSVAGDLVVRFSQDEAKG